MLLNHAVNTRRYFGQLGELVCKRDFRSAIPDRRFPIAGTIFMPREGVNGTSQITSHNPPYTIIKSQALADLELKQLYNGIIAA